MSENTAGADQGAQDQPTQDKGMTDFNDLICAAKDAGLSQEQIAELLMTKLNQSIDPVPRLKELTKDAAEEAELKEALRRYRQITKPGQLTTDVWDTNEKTKLKKTLFTSKVGPRISKLWFESSPAQIDSYTVASSIAEQTGKGSDELRSMNERFVLIEGTKDVWDNKNSRRTPIETLKLSHPNEYLIWLNSPSRKMVDAERVVFDPSGREFQGETELSINTFQGLPLKPNLTDDQIEQHSLPVRRLLEHLCAGDFIETGAGRIPDMTMFNWIMRWLAIPLQNLGTKLDTALIIHGMVQGAGKSLFFGEIMRRIYGRYSITLSQGDLETQYNDWVDSKLLAVFEEIFSGSDRFTGMGFVKQLITGSKLRISKKFVSGYELSNYVNNIFLSNEMIPLKLEQNDRRHAVCHPTGKIPADLLAEVSAGLEDPEDLMCRAFYAYLLRLSLVDEQGVLQTAHTHPPLNKAKLDLIELSRPTHEAFVVAWRSGEIPHAPYMSARTDDLIRAYRYWCQSQNRRATCGQPVLSKYIDATAPPGERKGRFKCYSSTASTLVTMVEVTPPGSPGLSCAARGDEIDKFAARVEQFGVSGNAQFRRAG